MPPEVRPKTPLAVAIYARMKEKDVSIHQLSEATGVCYERARTAVTGDEPPGKRLLRDICRVLQLDLEPMTEMLITEQMKRKHGRLPMRLAGSDPELQSIGELWQLLLPEEKEHIVWLVGRYAEKRGRREETVTPVQRIAPRAVRAPHS